MATEEQRAYELGLLINPTLGDTGAELHLGKVTQSLKETGSTVSKTSPLNKITLAYQIEKKQSAYFGSINFNAAPLHIAPLRHQLNLDNNVMRFLIITSKKQTTIPVRRDDSDAKPQKIKQAEPAEIISTLGSLNNEELEKRLKEILK
ncbi:MAG: 30S ribosomal protein S6 [Parcubacteria group bacterium RIFCSPLOWO2_01_FULL_48_18]|nr:MAG: 30S ribosomal protein S6 [Parcubacteria group bacterium RIFCSPHIGHO2_02_FULL_48_10b]OHB21955.1 MAG: 30S ribosomal protein S6 [Parcubacteria group bacterium RIFCSPLOWO2_01_FULL_48_18]